MPRAHPGRAGARRVRRRGRGRRTPRGGAPSEPSARPAARRPRRRQGPDRRRRPADRARALARAGRDERRGDRRPAAGGRRGDRGQDQDRRARPRRTHARRERPARREPQPRRIERRLGDRGRSRSRPPRPRDRHRGQRADPGRGVRPDRALRRPRLDAAGRDLACSRPASTGSASSPPHPATSPWRGQPSAARSAQRRSASSRSRTKRSGTSSPSASAAARDAAAHLQRSARRARRAVAAGLRRPARGGDHGRGRRASPRGDGSRAGAARVRRAAIRGRRPRRRARLEELGAALREAVGEGVLVLPALPARPPRWAELETTDAQLQATGWLTRLCGPVNSSGLVAVSVPSDVQVVARADGDRARRGAAARAIGAGSPRPRLDSELVAPRRAAAPRPAQASACRGRRSSTSPADRGASKGAGSWPRGGA